MVATPVRLAVCLGGVGIAAIGVAIGWWMILFPTVVENTGLTFTEALPCIASNSDVCSLAMALCGARHIFGIKQYSPGLFWVGMFFLGASLLTTSRAVGKKR